MSVCEGDKMSNTTSVVPAWKAEFDDRIAKFASIISVDESKVREIFSEIGADGKSEQSLTILESEEFLPMSDLFKFFVDSKLTQIAKVRLANSGLRARNTQHNVPVSEMAGLAQSVAALANNARPRTAWSDEELLAAYDMHDTETLDVLRKRTNGRFCIVFNQDGSINKDTSLTLVRLAKKQVTFDTHLVDGELVRVCRAGEFPVTWIDESPFFPGKPLVAGVCGESATDWNDISHEIRVLCRLHVFDIEIVKLSKTTLREIWSNAKSHSFSELKKVYIEAAMKYADLQVRGELPKLRIDPRHESQVPTGNVKKDKGF